MTKKTSDVILLAPLFASILPFALWPIEYFLPYPYIVEEIAKGIVVATTGGTNRSKAYLIVIASGVMFALSESVLYMVNIASVGSLGTLFTRLLLTIPLHTGTMLIMLAFYRHHKYLISIGFLIAVGLHYWFNYLINLYVLS